MTTNKTEYMREYQRKNRATQKEKEKNIKEAIEILQKIYDRQTNKFNATAVELGTALKLLKPKA